MIIKVSCIDINGFKFFNVCDIKLIICFEPTICINVFLFRLFFYQIIIDYDFLRAKAVAYFNLFLISCVKTKTLDLYGIPQKIFWVLLQIIEEHLKTAKIVARYYLLSIIKNFVWLNHLKSKSLILLLLDTQNLTFLRRGFNFDIVISFAETSFIKALFEVFEPWLLKPFDGACRRALGSAPSAHASLIGAAETILYARAVCCYSHRH